MVFSSAGKNSNVISDPYKLLDCAIHQKNDDEVVRLLNLVDEDDISFLLFSAVVNRYTYAVERLAPKSGTTQNNHSLGAAVSQKYIDGVKLLLPIADPRYNDSACLQRAVLNRDAEMFELLYPVSDAKVALQGLKRCAQFKEQPDRKNEPLFVELSNRVLRDTLRTQLACCGNERHKIKI